MPQNRESQLKRNAEFEAVPIAVALANGSVTHYSSGVLFPAQWMRVADPYLVANTQFSGNDSAHPVIAEVAGETAVGDAARAADLDRNFDVSALLTSSIHLSG